jgi:hypothetical protein
MSREKPETIVTPSGIAKYPRLNSPDTKFNAAGDYKITVVLDKADKGVVEFLKRLETEHKAAYQQAVATAKKGKKVKAAESPIKPHVNEDGDEVKGKVEISAKMRASGERDDGTSWEQRPAIFDASRKTITAKVGGGSKVKVAVELNPYNSPSLGAGLSLRLKAVQVLELVEFNGERSASSYGFSEEEGFSGEAAETTADTTGEEEPDFGGEESEESSADAESEGSGEEAEQEDAPAPVVKKTTAKKPAGLKGDF